MSCVRRSFLSFLFSYTVVAGIIPAPTTPLYPRSNVTTAPSSLQTGTSNSSVCCFVLQDTVVEEWWAAYSTGYYYYEINVTSVITSITQYLDTTVTNYTTIVNTSNSTSTSIENTATLTIDLFPNLYTKGVVETAASLNGTIVATGGTTITSPQAFYVYSTIKIITAQAVTQANGQLACGTTSVFGTAPGLTVFPSTFDYTLEGSTIVQTETGYSYDASTIVYTGINSNLRSYYDLASTETDYTTFQRTLTYEKSETQLLFSNGSVTGTTTVPPGTVTFTMTQDYFAATDFPMTGTTISFSTPYVYVPQDRSVSGAFGAGAYNPSGTCYGTQNVDYGYVPQDLINWAAANSDYLAQYPELLSCLPGGPPITPIPNCAFVLPSTLGAATDLTVSTAVTVNIAACFRPGNCPISSVPASTPAIATSSFVPIALPTTQTKSSSAVQPPLESVASSQPIPIPVTTKLAPSSASPVSNPNPIGSPNPNPNPTVPANLTPAMPTNPNPVTPPQSTLTIPSANPLASPPISSEGTEALAAVIASVFGISSPGPQSGNGVTSTPPTQVSGFPAEVPTIVTIAPQISIGGSIITANSQSQYIIGSQTLAPGGPPITVSGNVLSLAPSATAIVIGSTTIPISPEEVTSYIVGPQTLAPNTSPSNEPSTPAAVPTFITLAPDFTIGTSIITANSKSQYIIGSQTLTPGGPPITVSGTVISLGPPATAVIIGSTTIPLSVIQETAFIIGTQTLIPGASAITISGEGVSLATSGNDVVIGGTTLPLAVGSFSSALLTIGTQVVTENSASQFIVGGQTITAGATVATISGSVVTFAPAGGSGTGTASVAIALQTANEGSRIGGRGCGAKMKGVALGLLVTFLVWL